MINSILDAIGNTPLVRLKKIESVYGIGAKLYAKLESFNPFGSIKDRAALAIIKEAIDQKHLQNKIGIIDATSGNMGISLAAISRIFNLNCTIVMPENASQKRKDLLKTHGAKVILTSADGGIGESIEVARKISNEQNDYFYTNQFENTGSIEAHFSSTAPEIERQLGHKPDIIISGIGTGGTIMGIAKYYKQTTTQIYGTIPAEHFDIPGLRADISSPIIDEKLINKVIAISNNNLKNIQNGLLRYEGIFAGWSSCASLSACIDLSKNNELNAETIVIIFPDSGERYI